MKDYLPGYMTLEATFVFVTVVSVLLFSFSVGMYQYKRCVLELDSYYDLQCSVYLKEAVKEDINMEAYKANIERECEITFGVSLFENRDMKLKVEAEKKILRPADLLRLVRRVKRSKGDIDSDD